MHSLHDDLANCALIVCLDDGDDVVWPSDRIRSGDTWYRAKGRDHTGHLPGINFD
jgi:hypothetical protein